MRRMALRLAIIAAMCLVASVAFAVDASVLATPGSKVIVVYLGADDCGYCGRWEGAAFSEMQKSEEAKWIDFRSIKRLTFRTNPPERDLPDDLKWIYPDIRSQSRTPSFVVIDGGKIILKTSGTDGWKNKAWPLVRKLVAAKKGAGVP